MVIVRISSGLGNQMFQYALLCALETQGVPVKADLGLYRRAKDGRAYELENVFGLQPALAGPVESGWMQAISKIGWKSGGKPYKEYDESFGFFNPAILRRRHAYLNGYWQSEQYFSAISPVIRERFRFPDITDKTNRHWEDRIRSCESVSLHIRRTDFVQQYNWGIAPAYYEQAIALLNERLQHPEYFVFTDDPVWAREHLRCASFHFVEGNTGAGSFRDMQLMSHCRHHIIANSSFSWWGAWLNPRKDKVVIAPDCWQPRMQGTRDIIPEGWIQLPTGMLHTNR
jgi:hypothetical protein